MTPLPKDSLDVVEMVMVIEEVFGIEIPNDDAEGFGNPREIVDWLEANLSNQRPNKQAADFLRTLGKKQQSPELAEGLDGLWRREQIAAIIREILK
jgi:acyl carrier protein